MRLTKERTCGTGGQNQHWPMGPGRNRSIESSQRDEHRCFSPLLRIFDRLRMNDEMGALTQIVDHHRRKDNGKPTDTNGPKTEMTSKDDRRIHRRRKEHRHLPRSANKASQPVTERKTPPKPREANEERKDRVVLLTDVRESLSFLSNQIDQCLIRIERFQNQGF